MGQIGFYNDQRLPRQVILGLNPAVPFACKDRAGHLDMRHGKIGEAPALIGLREIDQHIDLAALKLIE